MRFCVPPKHHLRNYQASGPLFCCPEPPLHRFGAILLHGFLLDGPKSFRDHLVSSNSTERLGSNDDWFKIPWLILELAGQPRLSLNLAQSIQDSAEISLENNRGRNLESIAGIVLGRLKHFERARTVQNRDAPEIGYVGVNLWFETPAFHGLSNS